MQQGCGDWGKATIIVQVNDGYIDFFCSWLKAYRDIQVSNRVLAVAYGDRTQETLELMLGRQNVIRSQLTVDGFHRFGFGHTAPFNELAREKISLMERTLNVTQQPVVFTDLDAIWLRNPLSFLTGELRAGLSAVAESFDPRANLSDPRAKQATYFCSCFVAACNDAAAREALARWREGILIRKQSSPGRYNRSILIENEQEALNRLVKDVGKGHNMKPHQGVQMGGFGIGMLPSSRFPSVRVVKTQAHIRPEYLWVHANYLIGRKRKTAALTHLNLWHPNCSLLRTHAGSAPIWFRGKADSIAVPGRSNDMAEGVSGSQSSSPDGYRERPRRMRP